MRNSIHPGETVLCLGTDDRKTSGRAAQIVGARGRVIGIDRQDAAFATSSPDEASIEFRHDRFHDLQLDLDQLEMWLQTYPMRTSHDWLKAEAHTQFLRQKAPLIASDSIDVVISHRALNLVPRANRAQALAELHRVLKRHSRVVIHDFVSDEVASDALQSDAISRAPYTDAITLVPPVTDIPLSQAQPFNCKATALRDPRETKRTGLPGISLLQIGSDCPTDGCC